MSTQVNIDLLERASEMADYWVGTQIQARIDDCIKRNDLEQLFNLVREAEAMTAQEEFYGYDML